MGMLSVLSSGVLLALLAAVGGRTDSSTSVECSDAGYRPRDFAVLSHLKAESSGDTLESLLVRPKAGHAAGAFLVTTFDQTQACSVGGTASCSTGQQSQCSAAGTAKNCSAESSNMFCSTDNGYGCSATGNNAECSAWGNGLRTECSTKGPSDCSATSGALGCSASGHGVCTAFKGSTGHCSVSADTGSRCTFGWEEGYCSAHNNDAYACSVAGQRYEGGICGLPWPFDGDDTTGGN